MEELLKNAEQKLEGTFNSKCAFNMIYKVLIHHVGEMREKIEQMREKAREICTHSLADHTVKSKHNLHKVTATVCYIASNMWYQFLGELNLFALKHIW